MSPRFGVLFTMDFQVTCVLFFGLFIGVCSAMATPSESPASCRGYCEIFSDICKNGGTCVEPAPCSNTGSCKCPPNYEGEHCQKLITPGEKAGQKAKPKPRVKNNLLMSLFRSLASPRFDRKFQNHVESKPTAHNKDDDETRSKQKQVKATIKSTTTTSTTTTTTTTPSTTTVSTTSTTPTTTTTTTTTTSPTTTTTFPTTTTQTTTTESTTPKPPTQKTKPIVTITTPVTTEQSSQEVTTVVSDVTTLDDRLLNGVSEETTTDEIPTSTEITKELETKKTSAVFTSGNTNPAILKVESLPKSSDGRQVEVVTTSLPTSNDVFSPSTTFEIVDGGKDMASTQKLSTEEAVKEATNPAIDISDRVVLEIVNPILETQREVTNLEQLSKPSKATEPQLINEMSTVVKSVIKPPVPIVVNTDSLLPKPIEVKSNQESTSITDKQITSPSVIIKNLLEDMPNKVPSDRVVKAKEALLSAEKALEKTVQASAKNFNSVGRLLPESSTRASSGTSNDIPKDSNPKRTHDAKKENVNKITSDDSSEQKPKTIDKIIKKEISRLTKEFHNSLRNIFENIVSESDSKGHTHKTVPEKETTLSNLDIIIPETINSVNQMDQHLSSRSNIENNVDSQLASSTPKNPKSIVNIQPAVEGQSIPDSRTTSAPDVHPTTVSTEQ